MEWNNKIGALHGVDMAFPFLDRDLIAFLMAAPGEMQNRNGVPRAMMRDAMRGVLPAPIVLRKWKGDFSDVVNAGVAQDFAFISKVLTDGSLGVARGYLDRGRLAEEVLRLQGTLEGPDCLGSWELTDLFGLELWLKLFLSERGPAARPEPLSQEAPS